MTKTLFDMCVSQSTIHKERHTHSQAVTVGAVGGGGGPQARVTGLVGATRSGGATFNLAQSDLSPELRRGCMARRGAGGQGQEAGGARIVIVVKCFPQWHLMNDGPQGA